MAWWQIWKQQRGTSGTVPDVTMPEGSRTAVHDGRIVRPAESTAAPVSSSGSQRRLEKLNRRRDGLRFDVEQGELAQTESNPWSERIALLEETLATIVADREAANSTPAAPSWPVPELPVEALQVTAGEPASVRFSISSESFLYAEEIDWDQRGGAVVRGDLRHQDGEFSKIVPPETPESLQLALENHLDSSLMTFATDMRDRALNQEGQHEHLALSDMASPCPVCGGWREWGGRCPACTTRDQRLQTLQAESLRIMDERAAEADVRHRLIERLPLSRRRLADVEEELTSMKSKTS